MQADIRLIPKQSWGAALNYFTGSKEHNIALRIMALKKGYKLNEYGLFRKNKFIAGRTEQELYKRLGLRYIQPELRENLGELEASRNNQLPKLVELKDIKTDLHVHTKYSDGTSSIQEMVDEARRLKYHSIAIADHFGSLKIAGSMDRKSIQKQWREIDSLNKSLNNFKIFKGAEVNIKLDGSLDIDNSTLKELDIVIASIHSGLKNNPTQRIIRAMENTHVNIIAHPSGRLLNKREGSVLHYEKLFRKAKATSTILEINSTPDRLDLDGINTMHAIGKNCRIAVNTDAHSASSLHFIIFGVGVARRGWCSKQAVINTFNLKKLEKILGKK